MSSPNTPGQGELVRRPTPSEDETPRERLRRDIESAMGNEFRRADEPSPTCTELIIIGAVLSHVEKPERHDVVHTIASQFVHYQKQVIEIGVNRLTSRGSSAQESLLEGRLFQTFRRSDLPLSASPDDSFGQYHFVIDLPAARIQLRKFLEPTRQGPFRCFDLPAELRTNVYEKVLGLPQMLCRGPSRTDMPFHSARRHSFSYETFLVRDREHENPGDNPGHKWFDSAPVQDVLALLSVSKRVHAEAAPLFYQNNKLLVNSRLLRHGISPPRLKHLGCLRIDYTQRISDVTIARHYEQFFVAEKLRMVTVDFAKNRPWTRANPIDEATVQRLRSIRAICTLLAAAQNFKLIGAPEVVEKHIQSQVEKLRAARKEAEQGAARVASAPRPEGPVADGKKRKRKVADADSTEPAKRRKPTASDANAGAAVSTAATRGQPGRNAKSVKTSYAEVSTISDDDE